PLVAASFVLAATVFAGLWYAARQQNQVRDAQGLLQEARMLSYRYPEIAQERLRRAEDLAPSLPGLGADRAYVLVRLRRRAEAEQAVQRVLAADPNNGPALAIEAGLLRGDNRAREADAVEERARARLAPDQLHYLALGIEDDARAIEILSRAVDT